MCGLVGLVQRYDPNASVDPAPLVAARHRLACWSPSAADAAAELAAVAATVEPLSRSLVAWSGLRSLRESPSLREVITELHQALVDAADAVDARLADPAQITSTQQAERFAEAVVATRDVAWRIERDALSNVSRVTALAGQATGPGETAGEASDPGLKGWFELWRINLILNQLERLEVRGRDSGGLATLVAFSPQGWAEAKVALDAKSAAALDARSSIRSLRDKAVLVCETPTRVTVAFAHKVAREVGELGANVRELRAGLAADTLYRSLLTRADAQVQVMAHTRWASNGIISQPNCHPVANDLAGAPALERVVLGVLNGDVDNFPTLAKSWSIPADCTTDAKIIPLEVSRHLESGHDLSESFRRAVASFNGSTAIAVLASDDPSATHIALRGSGQAIYVGILEGGGTLYASELYGVVELAPRFYKLEGDGGQVVRLGEETPALKIVTYDGAPVALDSTSAFKRAPIATRDIDRGGYSHYFLKEISEAPRSVERTLRGKFVLEGTSRARFVMGDDVIPAVVREGLAKDTIRRVFVIGQGTASVAGIAAADFMQRLLRPAAIEVRGLPATDLSGFFLDQLGSDCLVIAVSQSGTTTDTNRTVDLARERGAHVIGIVNRRGSDLVDKSDGCLYTSDGRDVEMSVASTKAFYCQVVAGYLLGLNLARLAGALSEEALASHLLRIQDLPRCLRSVLEETRERVRIAAKMSLSRRHWTVVGSGPIFQAAREIRIKLSELCYKSVSVDTIEDKKHIDLSSEPMILVCAAGLGGPAAADAVKEVAIFKAHAAVPIVICDRGETRFAEYAAATIEVPATSPEVALLLNTIAGHLFSYETAAAIDALADPLRQARDVTLAALETVDAEADDPVASEETARRLRRALARPGRTALDAIEDGHWNAAISASSAMRLARAIGLGLGMVPRTVIRPDASPASVGEILEHLQLELHAGIDALRRPIDAIKHQAKTVTVGISREAHAIRPPAGALIKAAVAADVPEDAISDAEAAALASLEPAIDACLGVVHYRLEDLSPLGAPTDESRIVVASKTGVAAELSSRADVGAPLLGTKRSIVRVPRLWVGHGQRDGRSLVLCPLYVDGLVSGLSLFHVRFRDDCTTKTRVRALRAIGRYEDLKCAVTEWDTPWDDTLLDSLSIEALLTSSVERLAEQIQGQPQQGTVAS